MAEDILKGGLVRVRVRLRLRVLVRVRVRLRLRVLVRELGLGLGFDILKEGLGAVGVIPHERDARHRTHNLLAHLPRAC